MTVQLHPPAGQRRGLLVAGDNLAVLAALPPAMADLVVTDPPFGTGRTRAAPGGTAAFEDAWEDPGGYLDFLRPRLVALRRALKPEGSIVVHLDYRAVHAVKLEMDRIFGRRRFVNEIIWHYTGGGRSRRCFSRKHDSLLWYAMGDHWTFNIDAVRVPYKPTSGYARGGIVARSGKRYQPHPAGTPVDDVWDIPMINPLARERCGYPTQKPLKLLDRLLAALCNAGDLVLDPFCGSGTTAVAAARLERRWIACDHAPEAIETAARRLNTAGAGDTFITREMSPIAPA